jgi:heme-degrading monooxygenase HmoA
MHARVTTISGSPADADTGIDNFRSNVVPFTREQGKGAILLVDRDSGEAISITLWDDEGSMRATEESANALRADAAGDLGATAEPKVGRYEVAVFEV